MKPSLHSINASIVVVGSCALWIGAITFALVHFFQLGRDSAWAIAGVLGLSTSVALTFIAYEIRHAVELPQSTDLIDFGLAEKELLGKTSGSAKRARGLCVSGEIC